MSNKLFDLSMKTSESLEKFIESSDNSKEVKKNMNDLLKMLHATCYENDDTDFDGYWKNVCSHEGWCTLGYLQSDIEYFSDRWCYERYKTVDKKWNLLKHLLKNR